MSRTLTLLVICVALFATFPSSAPAVAATLDTGFDDIVIGRVSRATTLAFLPDGRVLVGAQTGQVRIIKGGTLLPTAALDLSNSSGGIGSACSQGERGLLGLAVDPKFTQNGFIYIFYTSCPTSPSGQLTNRVARFTMTDDTINVASQRVLLDNIKATGIYHQGGGMQFGADGFLYIGTGDNHLDKGLLSQNPASLNGKILRIHPETGAGVPGNVYFGTAGSRRCGAPSPAPSGPCEEMFALGLRNPFRIAMRPGTSEFYINDVGQVTWEEVNVGRLGANYGWPTREGPCASGANCSGSENAQPELIFSYRHGSSGTFGGGCSSITGGTFVPANAWSAQFEGDYLFADYTCGKVFRLHNTPSGLAIDLFGSAFGRSTIVDLGFGPDRKLYYLNYTGEIGIIRFVGASNRAPEAFATANIVTGRVPLAVTFDGSQSRDPDGEPLSFSWFFGDGSSGSGAVITHTYGTTGTFEAVLTVTDAQGARATSQPIKVTPGNSAPKVTITTPPVAEVGFSVGQTITLQAAATDPEEGPLDSQSIGWEIWLHHDDHVHPFLQYTTGSSITITTGEPEDLPSALTNYLEVTAVVTDSRGLQSEVARIDLRPKLITVTLTSDPSGMVFMVNGYERRTPAQIPSWPNYRLDISAPSQFDGENRLIVTSWDDQPTGPRTIVTPAENVSYHARFSAAPFNLFVPIMIQRGL